MHKVILIFQDITPTEPNNHTFSIKVSDAKAVAHINPPDLTVH